MKKISLSFVILCLSVMFLNSCSKVPLTNRRQLNLISSSELLSMSFQEYSTFLNENSVSTNTSQTAMVKKVGNKIKTAVEQYFNQNGLSSKLNGYKWEFNLIDNSEANAWCMPGGKVVFYTGILPYTKDETGMAVVMGHEIAHAIADHGNERMSQSLVSEFGSVALSVVLQNKPETTQALWQTAYGLGSQVGVILPFSRLHENEADQLGLIFMAMAGYDPNQAVDFWTRMSQTNNSSANLEFLSTHPSNATRIRKIKGYLPEALKYYKP